MEFTITELNPSAEISIRTQNSAYRFSLTDRILCRGFLTGGILGGQQRDAFLAGAVLPNAARSCDSNKLETGTRALFYMDEGDKFCRLVTSVITELVLVKE
jgi:hypothetical protein